MNSYWAIKNILRHVFATTFIILFFYKLSFSFYAHDVNIFVEFQYNSKR